MQSPYGGIGRRERLKIVWCKPCRFESGFGDHLYKQSPYYRAFYYIWEQIWEQSAFYVDDIINNYKKYSYSKGESIDFEGRQLKSNVSRW